MAKGYWVVHLDVPDPDALAGYQRFIEPFLAANGGRFLIRGGRHEMPEGSARPRTVVVEFPTYAEAHRAYYSAEYQEGLKLRTHASTADFVIVEGVED